MFRYSRILLPTDFSYCSYYAMQYAQAFARRYRASLHLVHVVDTVQLLPWAYPSYWLSSDCLHDRENCLCERAAARLRHLVQRIHRGDVEADSHVLRGTPAVEIVGLARELECELIVVGTHGRLGVEHAIYGSVSEAVARHAPAPVLTIRHPEHEFVEFRAGNLRLQRVMFPTDFSVYSRAALPYAVSLCREFEATLLLVNVLEPALYGGEFASDAITPPLEDPEREGRERLEEIGAEFPGLRVELLQEHGMATHAIVDIARDRDVDLVVIPTHGRTGVARLLFGGVAQKVLRFAPCPVLTVRPDMAPVRQTAEEASAATAD